MNACVREFPPKGHGQIGNRPTRWGIKEQHCADAHESELQNTLRSGLREVGAEALACLGRRPAAGVATQRRCYAHLSTLGSHYKIWLRHRVMSSTMGRISEPGVCEDASEIRGPSEPLLDGRKGIHGGWEPPVFAILSSDLSQPVFLPPASRWPR